MRMRTLTLLGVSVAALGVGIGCGGSSSYGGGGSNPPPAGCTASNATPTASVSIGPGMVFNPSCMKVSTGATITFHNADTTAHTVTSDPAQPEMFDSGPISPGQDFTHTFATSAETVHIHCTIHPFMTATIVVQ